MGCEREASYSTRYDSNAQPKKIRVSVNYSKSLRMADETQDIVDARATL